MNIQSVSRFLPSFCDLAKTPIHSKSKQLILVGLSLNVETKLIILMHQLIGDLVQVASPLPPDLLQCYHLPLSHSKYTMKR